MIVAMDLRPYPNEDGTDQTILLMCGSSDPTGCSITVALKSTGLIYIHSISEGTTLGISTSVVNWGKLKNLAMI